MSHPLHRAVAVVPSIAVASVCGVVVCGVVVCGGCGGGDDLAPIRLGVVTSATGDLAVAGKNQQDAVLLAVEEINDGGGVLDRPLAVVTRDDATTRDGAAAAYTALLGERVAAIVGPIHSAGAHAIAAPMRTGRTLTVSGGATSPDLGALDDGGFFFRTVPSDAVQAVVLAQKIIDASRKNVCVVFRGDAYGSGLAQAHHHELDGAVMLHDAPYDPAAPSLTQVVPGCDATHGAAAPGIVFVTFESDGAVLLDDASTRGWTARGDGVFLVDGNRRAELFAALRQPDAFEGAVGTAPSGPAPESTAGLRLTAFQRRFDDRYGHLPATNAENHYDATYLAALAIQLAGDADDTAAIRDALGRTSSGAPVPTGDWAAARAVIASQGQLDYQGASGEVDLDFASGELLPPYYVRLWTVDHRAIVDREFVTIDE